MGGRGGSSGMTRGSSSFVDSLQDNTNFNQFVRQNLSNPEFMALGREEGMDAVRELWYEKRVSEEMDIYDAVDQVRDAIPPNVSSGWFRNADSDYKPKLVDCIMSNPGTLNAGFNIAYNNYRNSTDSPVSFDKWLRTPQTMFRGDHGQPTVEGDIFVSFTPDRRIAEKFGSNITTKGIRPIDTWGSFQTTGEQEFLVPVKRRR